MAAGRSSGAKSRPQRGPAVRKAPGSRAVDAAFRAARLPGGSGALSREHILRVAIEELADHGYPGMSLQVVADRLGLRKSSLFYHFKDKRDLATTAYLEVTEDMARLVAQLDTTGPPSLDQVRALVDSCVSYTASHPARARLGMRLFVDRTSAIRNVRSDDQGDPLVRSIGSMSQWLSRARDAGVIRNVDVGNAMLQLFSALLFYPSVAGDVGPDVIGDDPWSPSAVERWRHEATAFVCGGLRPEG